ncbi:hypothetical protein HU749_015005 [Pseudomonas ogarae]|uniref:hypothetical protein n=1 Tax=Pseudomonas ogarae (strain DSM 112162 / CECT 30235 / F113) TaxID=1114970 RepID=UPI00164746B8|nr:hypothetical protein [Pseudomonas zarinae]QXH92190.1 hypothetical protein HU749_015005 [Pseudomonas zarinae]
MPDLTFERAERYEQHAAKKVWGNDCPLLAPKLNLMDRIRTSVAIMDSFDDAIQNSGFSDAIPSD